VRKLPSLFCVSIGKRPGHCQIYLQYSNAGVCSRSLDLWDTISFRGNYGLTTEMYEFTSLHPKFVVRLQHRPVSLILERLIAFPFSQEELLVGSSCLQPPSSFVLPRFSHVNVAAASSTVLYDAHREAAARQKDCYIILTSLQSFFSLHLLSSSSPVFIFFFLCRQASPTSLTDYRDRPFLLSILIIARIILHHQRDLAHHYRLAFHHVV
jgi:hypothetical protein